MYELTARYLSPAPPPPVQAPTPQSLIAQSPKRPLRPLGPTEAPALSSSSCLKDKKQAQNAWDPNKSCFEKGPSPVCPFFLKEPPKRHPCFRVKLTSTSICTHSYIYIILSYCSSEGLEKDSPGPRHQARGARSVGRAAGRSHPDSARSPWEGQEGRNSSPPLCSSSCTKSGILFHGAYASFQKSWALI